MHDFEKSLNYIKVINERLCDVEKGRKLYKSRDAIALMAVQEILRKLNHIQLDLDLIKDHLADVEAVLTEDDVHSLQEAEEDLKKGKTKRLA